MKVPLPAVLPEQDVVVVLEAKVRLEPPVGWPDLEVIVFRGFGPHLGALAPPPPRPVTCGRILWPGPFPRPFWPALSVSLWLAHREPPGRNNADARARGFSRRARSGWKGSNCNRASTPEYRPIPDFKKSSEGHTCSCVHGRASFPTPSRDLRSLPLDNGYGNIKHPPEEYGRRIRNLRCLKSSGPGLNKSNQSMIITNANVIGSRR